MRADCVWQVSSPKLDGQGVYANPWTQTYGKEVFNQELHVYGNITFINLVIPLDYNSFFMDAIAQFGFYRILKGSKYQFYV